MFLKDYAPKGKLFIDANIFIYHVLDDPSFSESCSGFLRRVEEGEVEGVIDILVIDEVLFKILMGKASELVPGLTLRKLKRQMAENAELREAVYSAAKSYEEYISVLLATGLEVIEIDMSLVKDALLLGIKYGLLTADSIHLAAIRRFGISDIATNDSDFERVDFVKVWRPFKVEKG